MHIIYYTGGAYSGKRLVSCWQRNKARLEALGMVHISWLDLTVPNEKITRENIGAKLENPTLAPKFRQWLRDLKDREEKPRLLFSSDPQGLMFKHQRTKLLHGLLRQYFPEARQSILFSPGPADLEIEAATTWNLQRGIQVFPRFFLGPFLRRPSPRLSPVLQEYDAMVGEESVQPLVWHEDSTFEYTFLNKLMHALGVAKVPDDFDLTVNEKPAVSPRDLVWFWESVNPLLAQIDKPVPFNWFTFPGFWRAGRRRNVLFSDAIREGIRSKFDRDDDATLRERFGICLDDLTPPEALERKAEESAVKNADAERPFGYADALRLAKALPEDFLRVLAQGPHIEEHFQRAQTRICLQAIRDAAAKTARVEVKDDKPKVAVLTATYNHAEFIAQNIESVIAQKTAFPITHIIADDASTDGTQNIILEYAAQYPHIKAVFRKTKFNDSRNYQCLYEMADTQYVAMCEGDDYFTDENKIQTQYDFLEANPDCALHFHRVRVIYEHGDIPERVYPREEDIPGGFRPVYTLEDLVRGNMIQTNSVMYRWRFPDGLPLWYDPSLMPADWYMHLLHAETGSIGFSKKIMSVYRRHAAAQFYLAETDRLKHRVKFGKQELRFFAEMDKHFLFMFTNIYRDLAMGVLVDLMHYGDRTGDMTILEEVVEAFPQFGLWFLRKVKATL